MNFLYRFVFLSGLVSAVTLASLLPNSNSVSLAVEGCPVPALSRFRRHKVARGDTLVSIAQRYNLVPETIVGMNPSLQDGSLPAVGSELQIPPFNGVVVEVPRNQTWRQVAARYKVRPDTLFEVNGCQKDPRIVFVPGINWSPNGFTPSPKTTTTSTARIQLSGYPFEQIAEVALPYGWQINPNTGQVFFHSGIDLLADVGTSVEAIAPGRIVFAQEQGTYGNLVIINHNGGLQSRYAHLDSIQVKVGQQVNQGQVLGTVGTTGQPTGKQSHLHFEIRSSSSLGWVAENPKDYLKP
ncbi:metalloendopeptidase-like membrane protein [Nostoc sp. PCC 7524]|uniref:peptidoglycan DD-metalloendopeptidase family protein n=1 Tax=Nostoc sp. (strain ATCC 29411 / PCC 7524) TaxID=28072 RepID=UPI00029F49B5|nr:M23 family metallopeptidase [Nostoc sp. PCC 7524]AFY49620.1 metalloendopeptidase-like membrane protein [Nostoc sp. PCC 7524]